ncbi:sensor histidine kinase [Gordonia soli]|nr:histidine kinase [Gordonia soli]
MPDHPDTCFDEVMWRVRLTRAQLNDVGIALIFVALGIGLQVSGLNPIGWLDRVDSLPGSFPLITLGVAAAGDLMRSTRPTVALAVVSAALVVDVVTVPSIAVWLILSDAVYAVCVYAGSRAVRFLYASALAFGVVALAALIATEPDWRLVFLSALWLVAFVGSPIGYGKAVREHRTALVSERARARAMTELAERERVQAVSEERRRLARELHDVIAGQLSSIAVQSAAGLRATDDPDLTAAVLKAVRQSSVDALSEMRTMIDLLADDSGEVTPDRQTASLRRVDHLVDPIRATGTAVSVSADVDDLPAVVDIAGYRIVAESLTNAARHAEGSPIDIEIRSDERELVIHIANPLRDGRSAVPVDRPRRGLENMYTRARSVGGTLHAGVSGGRFVVDARLPLESDGAVDVPAAPTRPPIRMPHP